MNQKSPAQANMNIIRWIPPGLIICFVVYLYVVLMACHIFPQLQLLSASAKYGNKIPASALVDPHAVPASLASITAACVLFHLFFFLFFLSFARTTFSQSTGVPNDKKSQLKWELGYFAEITREDDQMIERIIQDPGVDLSNPEIRNLVLRMPLVERKKAKAHNNPDKTHEEDVDDGLKRKCQTCRIFKPDRCHHCRVCNSCVPRMDHHCPWVNNCIGFKNYKFFLLLLLYASLTSGTFLVIIFPRFLNVFKPVVSTHYFIRADLPVALATLFGVMIFTVITGFFMFHMFLTFNNMTTIEYREKRNHDDEFIRHKFQVAHIKYDRGYYGNFIHIFGPPWIWFLPIEGDPSDDGTYSNVLKKQDKKQRRNNDSAV